MTGVVLHTGHVADLPDVMRIMAAAFDPRFGEAWNEAQCLAMIATPGCRLVLARSDEVVGFALSRTVLDTCELMLLAVAPEARNKSVGRALLQDVVDFARTSNATTVFLEMRDGNSAGHLYSSFGFERIGRRSNYYRGVDGELVDALTYQFGLI